MARTRGRTNLHKNVHNGFPCLAASCALPGSGEVGTPHCPAVKARTPASVQGHMACQGRDWDRPVRSRSNGGF